MLQVMIVPEKTSKIKKKARTLVVMLAQVL